MTDWRQRYVYQIYLASESTWMLVISYHFGGSLGNVKLLRCRRISFHLHIYLFLYMFYLYQSIYLYLCLIYIGNSFVLFTSINLSIFVSLLLVSICLYISLFAIYLSIHLYIFFHTCTCLSTYNLCGCIYVWKKQYKHILPYISYTSRLAYAYVRKKKMVNGNIFIVVIMLN